MKTNMPTVSREVMRHMMASAIVEISETTGESISDIITRLRKVAIADIMGGGNAVWEDPLVE